MNRGTFFVAKRDLRIIGATASKPPPAR